MAAAAGRIVSAIINDTHEILPVSIKLTGEYGVENLAISVPVCIGRSGAISIKKMNFTEEEKAAFENSVSILSETASSVCAK